jgi:hypothetical protein
MMLLYTIAAAALMFVAYLVHDFYNEQLRTRMIPARAERRHPVRREDRRLAR